MPNKFRSIVIFTLFLALCAGAAVVTMRAMAQGASSAPEESATIDDDPTVAPDADQSADNNVSFPVDI